CTISLWGGIFGLAIGVLTALLISNVGGWPFHITASSVLISMTFSIIIGLFFGIYPASRAASLDPVDALSYE
ncbi:MAG: MacB family efflux pump subunit, partial [Desulfobacterales bacterium]|nr:MacB family efflux pump subunit [Desulfobacterales bacterium]